MALLTDSIDDNERMYEIYKLDRVVFFGDKNVQYKKKTVASSIDQWVSRPLSNTNPGIAEDHPGCSINNQIELSSLFANMSSIDETAYLHATRGICCFEPWTTRPGPY